MSDRTAIGTRARRVMLATLAVVAMVSGAIARGKVLRFTGAHSSWHMSQYHVPT
jgi:hypothetical protein